MNQEIHKNLGVIRDEAMSMIDNIASVRGEKYAEMTRMLLNAHQLASVIGFLCEVAGEQEENREILPRIAEVSEHLIAQIAMSATKASGMNAEQMSEVMVEAERMRDWVDGQIKGAVDAAQTGRGFGGADAA